MKIIKFILGLIVLGIVAILSVVLFVYLAAIAAAVLGYLWWKTRSLRKNLRNALQARPPDLPTDGFVIEGCVIREADNAPLALTNSCCNARVDAPELESGERHEKGRLP